jgi:hypothetical protein
VICDIFTEAGFSHQEVLQIYTLGADVAYPLVNVGGDVVMFFGTNPSGHPLTVVINSMVNSLYMRYVYTTLNPSGNSCETFQQDVHLMTYGDDNIMGVRDGCEWFNHGAIKDCLATIGVEYTMADKEAESVPYININDCQFLKRSWRYEPELENYACPLDMSSVHKSLVSWVPSRSIDQYAQMVAVISSANLELFFHGKEVFHKHHTFFKEVLQTDPYVHYVNESTLPGWEDLCTRYRKASEGVKHYQPLNTV